MVSGTGETPAVSVVGYNGVPSLPSIPDRVHHFRLPHLVTVSIVISP